MSATKTCYRLKKKIFINIRL